MPVDFTKLAFPRIENPRAATLTEAITVDPVAAGFVVITYKATDPATFAGALRDFAYSLRARAADTGLLDVTAYRQLQRDELGGSVPYDQPICEALLEAARRRERTRQMGALTESIVLANPHADWVLLLEYRTPPMAADAARALADPADDPVRRLTSAAREHTVGAFKNMMGYAAVSRDPNVVQFFNLFGAPGDLEALWPAWQEALPWFFEIAAFRSSFPLLALDATQPVLLVNYAHCDSTKQFLLGTLYDPAFMEVMESCYVQRQVTLPTPFFCKIVPI